MRLTVTHIEVLRLSLECEAWRTVRDYAGDDATPADLERTRRAVNTLTRQRLLCQRVRNGVSEWNRALDSDKYREAVQIVLRNSHPQPA